MDDFPKIGMTHQQARERALRHAKGGNPNVVSAVIRQAELHEKGSGQELLKEIKKDYGRKRVDIY